MKSTNEDYKARTISELADEAMAILNQSQDRVLRCAYIGERLFADHASIRGSCPFARLAGKVMRHLERQGRVAYGDPFSTRSYGWYSREK